MTRIIYDMPVQFETNGDCSKIQINFPSYMNEEDIEKLRQQLKGKIFSLPSSYTEKGSLILSEIVK